MAVLGFPRSVARILFIRGRTVRAGHRDVEHTKVHRELAAMVIVDAVARQLPGVLGNEESAGRDSFVDGLLDCPHYTRPELFNDKSVPAVLLSGDHKAIARWRRQQALARTRDRRPDLLATADLTTEDKVFLTSLDTSQGGVGD